MAQPGRLSSSGRDRDPLTSTETGGARSPSPVSPPLVSWRAGAQVAVIGFGAWLIRGGFVVDRRALEGTGLAEADAGSR